MKGGLLKPPKQKWQFQHFLKVLLSPKNFTFPKSLFFEVKMTKIDILNQKLIVTNYYQQFWVHFEWFLSQKWHFWGKKPILKKVSYVIFVP